MKQMSQGDVRAFEMLYERYFDKLTWFATGFVNEVQQAEDLVQEVFLRLIERPASFDAGQVFSTWIYAVTANACRNHLRNQQNRDRLLSEKVLPRFVKVSTLHHEGDYRLLQSRLEAAIAALSEKERNIFVLRFEHEQSIKQIADALQIPEGSVKSGLYHLLRKIAIRLKEFIHEN